MGSSTFTPGARPAPPKVGRRGTYSVEQNHTRIELANGLVGYPHSKVAKRLEHGSEHSLEASTGTASPVNRPRTRSPH
jgi:hypothetical protein